MYPARQFQVVSSFNSGNQLKIIHLKEIHPPFPLIHIPQSTTNPIKEIQPSFSQMHISQTPSSHTYQNKKLQQLIEQCEFQSNVDLGKQNLNDEDMEIVVKEAIINKQCKALDISCNKITAVGASTIAKALTNNTTLGSLYLRGNSLSDTGIQSLTKTLSVSNSRVRLLDLQINGITDEGAKYIAEMLKTNATLWYLLLSGNDISDRGVDVLAHVLTHHNTTLISLRVGYNKLVSDSSVDSLIKMLQHNQTIGSLDIEKCNLSDKGKERLRQVTRSKNAFDLKV
jgi:Ran GTPase-activating protein (RanGAP) involved in mRNA processing and transport